MVAVIPAVIPRVEASWTCVVCGVWCVVCVVWCGVGHIPRQALELFSPKKGIPVRSSSSSVERSVGPMILRVSFWFLGLLQPAHRTKCWWGLRETNLHVSKAMFRAMLMLIFQPAPHAGSSGSFLESAAPLPVVCNKQQLFFFPVRRFLSSGRDNRTRKSPSHFAYRHKSPAVE